MGRFRSITASNTAEVVNNGTTLLNFLNIVNRHSAAIFVKFYQKTTAATASDTPILTLQVAANSSQFYAQDRLIETVGAGKLYVRCVTENTDAGTTSPATTPIIEAGF